MIKKIISIGLCVLVIAILMKLSKNLYENFNGSQTDIDEISKQVDDLEKTLKNDLKENKANIKCPGKFQPIKPIEPSKPDCPICPKCPDISNYVLKSEIPSCPDMRNYIHKKEIPPYPDMSQYIKKTDIPPYPDMSEYIKKSEIPPCNCPIPVNPVIPVTPDTPPLNPMIPAEVTDPKEIQADVIATRTFPDTFVKPKFNLNNLMASNWHSDYFNVKGIGSRTVKKGMEGVTRNGGDLKFNFDKVIPSNLNYRKPEKCN